MVERWTLLTGLSALGALTLLGCGADDDQAPPRAPSQSPSPSQSATAQGPPEPRLDTTIVEGLAVPWGIAFLRRGDALVSQRDAGSIVRITPDGDVTELGTIAGVEGQGGAGGEGGLLGLAVPPEDESALFAFVTTSSDNRVVRMHLDGDSIGEPEPILTGIAKASHHNGGRLLFDADGLLFASTGDAGDRATSQDTDALTGKILRMTQDGKPAPGNPFDNHTWSYGHRNVEGLALDDDGRLWASEFGDKKADELNLIERGGNYGWPDVEGASDDKALVSPKVTWGTDECSPAGIAIARSTAFIGALQGECVFAVALKGEQAGKPRRLFGGDHGRLRTVAAAPDGSLWVTTSNTDGRGSPSPSDDRILRVAL